MAQPPFNFGVLNAGRSLFSAPAPSLRLNTLSTGGSAFNFGNTLGGSTASIGSTTQATSEIEKTLLKLTTQGGQLSANITKATKFSELTEADQKLIADIEQYIQNQKLIMSNVESTHLPDLNDYVKEVANESRALFQKLAALMNELQVTHNQIDERVKNLEEQITIVDSGKRFYDEASQGQSGNILQLGDNIFSKYYHGLINSFEERLRQYSTTIEEIERNFSELFQNHGSDTENKDLASLNESMRSQHQSFMAITGKVATLHEEMDKLREKYLKFRRVYFSDNSNPFEIEKEPSIDISREAFFNERKPAQELAKNLPVVTSAAQLNQLNPPSQIELIKPAQPLIQSASQPNLFGQPASQSNLFGQPASQPSLFGQPASQPSLFGQPASQPSLFGQPASQPSLFGSQPSFGQSTSQPSLFGSTSQSSLFGRSTSQPSLFGQTGNLFGQPASQPSLFSQTSNAFGQPSQPSAFGQPSQPSAFGQPSQPSAFGQPSQPSAFGSQPSAFGSQPSAFGSQPSAFGSQPSAFGSQHSAFGSQPSAFGSQSQPSAFGQTSTATSKPFNFRPTIQTTQTTNAFNFKS